MSEEELGNKEEPRDAGELDRIAETFAKVKEFLEAGEFTFGSTGNNGVATPIKKVALSTRTNYYKSLVMKPGHTIQKLYPVLDQCKVMETETLKTEKSHLIRQLHGLKLQYDTENPGPYQKAQLGLLGYAVKRFWGEP